MSDTKGLVERARMQAQLYAPHYRELATDLRDCADELERLAGENAALLACVHAASKMRRLKGGGHSTIQFEEALAKLPTRGTE